MMNAACVRLMMLRIPQTIEKPSPTRASMQPWSSPFRRCCRKSTGGPRPRLPLVPSGGRPDRLAVGGVGWPDGHLLTFLPLLDGHRLEDVDAALVELDLAVEGDEVELGEGVAHRHGLEA